MGREKKKKRKKKITVFGCVEGVKTEKNFLDFLLDTYCPKEKGINVNLEDSSGGTPDHILNIVIKNCHYDRCFAWLDEDFEPISPLSVEVREKLFLLWMVNFEEKEEFLACPIKDLQGRYNLKLRNPILIVSRPVCCESLILATLEQILPVKIFDPEKRDHQISSLKNKLRQVVGTDQISFYKANLSLDKLELKRGDLPELNLLIQTISEIKK